MSTKGAPGPFDGMERAAPGEPVFTLRAHDPLASGLVLEWVDRRRKAIREAFAREEISEAKRDLELIQCREAEELAWSMDAWRKGELAARAEELEGAVALPPTSYSGNAHSEEELAAKLRYDAIRAAGALLSNAVAGITDAAKEHLAPHGFMTERAVILTVAERIKAVADHIRPKRASYAVGEPELEPLHLEHGLITGAHLCDLLHKLEGPDADPS